jgi:predicted dehydrogenase
MALRVAIIGCGDIAHAYVTLSRHFPSFEIVGCASRTPERAEHFAAQHKLLTLNVDDALAGKHGIEAILNLTPPNSHYAISRAALENGLHVYTEKPLATSLDEGRKLLTCSQEKGLRLGGAPDTFLGAALQCARDVIDNKTIGDVVFGQANFISGGMEHRHPNPEFFFKTGGGPVFDIGPYYVTALVSLLGPVASVSAIGTIGRPIRSVSTSGSPQRGSAIHVEVPTTVQALLRFRAGAQISMSLSWDSQPTALPHIDLHGTLGRAVLPDPDFFGGSLKIIREDSTTPVATEALPWGRINWPEQQPSLANYRGLGLADFAQAIADDRPHRASGEMAFHVLEVLTAISTSTRSYEMCRIGSTCERPLPISNGASH